MARVGGADIVPTDVDVVVSDLHVDHATVIDYCRDERFETAQAGLDDTNWALLVNWNRRVDAEDTVVFVGDFAWFVDGPAERGRPVGHARRREGVRPR